MHFCAMKISLWFVLLLALTATSCSKKSTPSSKKENLSYQVVFYNVENLFDTINQEGVNDGEFTPTAIIYNQIMQVSCIYSLNPLPINASFSY